VRASLFGIVLSFFALSAYAQSYISGGMLYGGPSQGIVVCYVYNSGNTTQTTNHGIADESGSPSALVLDSCGYSLIPSRGSCALVARVDNTRAHSCYFQGNTYQGSIPNLRGVLQILDSSWHPITSVPLQ
jgi:hypothetical protein